MPVLPDLDALEAAAKRATPGPWRTANVNDVFTHEGAKSASGVVATPNDAWQVCSTSEGATFAVDGGLSEMSYMEKAANAEFIAACSPDVVTALIQRVRNLEAQLHDCDNEVRRMEAGW